MKFFNLSVKVFAILILFNLVVFAQNNKKLSGKHWVLTEIESSEIGATQIFIEFDESKNRLSGYAGCNNISGTIKLKGETLKFSSMRMTIMACQQGKTALLERKFVNTLEKTTSYKKSNDVLTLYAGKTAILKFTDSPKDSSEDTKNPVENIKPKNMPAKNSQSNASANIEDKKWIFNSAGSEQPEGAEIAFITFHSANKNANGDSGCNGFGGEYTISGDQITFTQTMATDRMCLEESRKNISSKFVNGLGTANRFAVVNGSLNLYHDEELLITLRSTEK